MILRFVIALCVLIFLACVMIVLVRRMRGARLSRLAVYLLFPLSQMCIIAFLYYYTIAYDLSAWMFFIISVAGAICGPVDLALFKALREAEQKDIAQERVRLLEEQLNAQKSYYRRLVSDQEKARQVRRDIVRELESVDALLCENEISKASDDLVKTMARMDSAIGRYCEHQAVDALIAMKAKVCEDLGIEVSVELDVPETLPFSSVELCAVFSNMLDNATNACEKVAEGERFIKLKACVAGGFFMVEMKNSCFRTPSSLLKTRRQRRGEFVEHGWGLSILEGLANRHDGSFDVELLSGEFRTTILLNMSGMQPDR